MLVTRPAPAATRTAARLQAAGHAVLLAPLLKPQPVAWELPADLPSAVAFTSAAAARLGGPLLQAVTGVLAFCVGDATAAAVRAAGFVDVRVAGGTAAALFEAIAATGIERALHLAGAERTAGAPPAGLRIDVVTVYRTALAPALPAETIAALRAGAVDLVLLHSPRTALHFAALYDAAGLDRGGLRIAALSPAVLAAAGGNWRARVAAPTPTEAALLATAGLVCDNMGEARRGDEG